MNSYQDILAFIFVLLEKTAPIPGNTNEQKANYRFLDAGHVSSFEVMQFVMEIELAYQLEFSPAELESDEMRTPGGIAKLIVAKRS